MPLRSPTTASLAGGAALLIIAGGVVAIVLAPWKPMGRVGSQGASGTASPERTTRATLTVVEQDSPIVDRGGLLQESLGLESPLGVFLPLLPKGSPTPARRTIGFGTAKESQNEIVFHLLRGASDKIAEDHSLGWYRVTGLPAVKSGAAGAIVLFRVAEGTVQLVALSAADQRPLPIQRTEPPPGRTP